MCFPSIRRVTRFPTRNLFVEFRFLDYFLSMLNQHRKKSLARSISISLLFVAGELRAVDKLWLWLPWNDEARSSNGEVAMNYKVQVHSRAMQESLFRMLYMPITLRTRKRRAKDRRGLESFRGDNPGESNRIVYYVASEPETTRGGRGYRASQGRDPKRIKPNNQMMISLRINKEN